MKFKDITNKSKIIYYTHIDLDGVGCAVLLKDVLKDVEPKLNRKHINYNEIDEEIDFISNSINNYTHIIFTDLSFTEDQFVKLVDVVIANPNTQFFVLDHHKTCFFNNHTEMNKLDNLEIIFSNKYSATKLFYRRLTTEYDISKYDKFIELVDVRDLWREDDLALKEKADRLNLLSILLNFDGTITRFLTNPNVEETNNEKDIINNEINISREKINKLISSLNVYIDDNNHYFAYIDSPEVALASNTANSILNAIYALKTNDIVPDMYGSFVDNIKSIKDIEKVEYVAIKLIYGTVSLRSNKKVSDFDVSAIAKACNGGGHSQAAGCPADIFLTKYSMIKN